MFARCASARSVLRSAGSCDCCQKQLLTVGENPVTERLADGFVNVGDIHAAGEQQVGGVSGTEPGHCGGCVHLCAVISVSLAAD